MSDARRFHMRRIINSLLTVVASLALVSPLYASTVFTEQARGTTFYQNPELSSGGTSKISQELGLSAGESADQLIGKSVVAQDGENLGKVRDLKIDTHTGRIDYVIVEKENAMGVGESQFVPVPLAALSFTDEDARLIVDKSRLDNVPSPGTMSAQEFNQDLHTHYGVAPGWQIERRTIHQEERKVITPSP
jgi:sporulation protein YlmC with PRC-barrel domain